MSMKKLKYYYLRLQKVIASRSGTRPSSMCRSIVARWFASPLGCQILLEEQQRLDELLPEMFGYHLMQLSAIPNVPLCQKSTTGHQFRIEPLIKSEPDKKPLDTCKASAPSYVRADFEQLPIDAESVDVAIIHHALEFSALPHQLLREVTRTLISNGHIILVGFNPYSLLGLRHTIGRWFSRSPVYHRHHLPVARLRDWFDVLDLDIVHNEQCVYGLPLHRYCSHPQLNRWLQCLLPFWGGCYVLVLRKNITPMTMIQSPWKKKAMLPTWRKGVAAQTQTHRHSSAMNTRANINEKN